MPQQEVSDTQELTSSQLSVGAGVSSARDLEKARHAAWAGTGIPPL